MPWSGFRANNVAAAAAGEADVRKRVRGKSDIPQHDKIADDGAEHRRQGPAIKACWKKVSLR